MPDLEIAETQKAFLAEAFCVREKSRKHEAPTFIGASECFTVRFFC